MKRITAASALLTASVCLAAAPAHAAPEPGEAINYTATNTETQTIIRTDAGSMVVEDGVFKVKAANGTTVAGSELSFRVDDFVFPIAAQITDRTATLTPQFDLAHAVYQPVALPYENQAPWKSEYERELAAWNRLTSTISMGATVGTLVGGMAGAAVGCVLGGVALGAVTGVLSLMFGALGGAVVGCLTGMSVVGFLGTLAGQLFVTAPVAILAAAQYFTTINQPFNTAK
ncbi:hypothetical protein [Nocardia huaxiensis]|uniref:DUF8020 domain-containing protein n=1 Tax=Nocardia huaxiensis TaxID=2755382 RepID=A0A7D6VAI6_9NOCA|nr:hypothetical protein [Nocardia huaxiensis]QLY30433.1 hypothetical protein H0264_35830 [Nocardia huaxiensis]UFS95970.1 DUF3482 domain-containing protein [Nocardia huaxiensis]